MSFEAERAAIVGMYHTAWVSNPTPTIYENASQIPPNGDFVYLRIVSGDGRQAEIVGTGTTLSRYEGLVQADIMIVSKTGTAKGKQLADTISGIFRRKQITDAAGGQITFKIPSVRAFGASSEGRYRVVVSIPYTRDIRE